MQKTVSLVWLWIIGWVVLFVLSVPFEHGSWPDPGQLLSGVFEQLYTPLLQQVLHLPYNGIILSDSAGLYLHVVVLSLLSLLLAVVLQWRLQPEQIIKLRKGLQVFIRYYLAWVLLIYGCSKLFKVQFYLPEPNILYTRVGDMHRDMLYWTTMGVSRGYTMFCGGLEIIAAALLLFKRTTLLGALLALGVLLNVVAVNFCYDISVKVFSVFLLLLAVVILVLHRSSLKVLVGMPTSVVFINRSATQPALHWLKLLVVTGMVASSLWPYMRDGNFNDDVYPRPPFHGAYQVSGFVLDGDTVPSTQPGTWHRVFVHREGYFIVQHTEAGMADYTLTVDTTAKTWLVKSYAGPVVQAVLHYQEAGDSLLHVSGDWNGQLLQFELKRERLETLPVLQKEFHWIVNE